MRQVQAEAPRRRALPDMSTGAPGSGSPPPTPPDPGWTPPWPLALSEGVQAAGTVAAPLLAGFSLTSLLLVLQGVSGSEEAERAYAGPADACIILLAAATVVLVFAVQFAMHARSHQVMPSQVFDWWEADSTNPTVVEDLRQHLEDNLTWSARAGTAYNAGVVLLLAAIPLLLVPTGPVADVSAGRWAAVAVGVVAFLAEVGWIVQQRLAD
jgi:hypothetical protein